jgi:hypothetical protein
MRNSAIYARKAVAEKDVYDPLFKGSEAGAERYRQKAIAEYKGAIGLHLPSYEAAWTKDKIRLKAFDFMAGRWQTIAAAFEAAVRKPWGLTDGWTKTADLLDAGVLRLQALIDDFIDPWAAGLIDLTAAEAAKLDDGMSKTRIADSWAAGVDQRDPYAKLSPVRELFMVDSINRLGRPGIVAVGEAHIAGLRGKIEDGRAFLTYQAFAQAISRVAMSELRAVPPLPPPVVLPQAQPLANANAAPTASTGHSG